MPVRMLTVRVLFLFKVSSVTRKRFPFDDTIMPNDWTDKMLSDQTYFVRFGVCLWNSEGIVYGNNSYLVCLLVFVFILFSCDKFVYELGQWEKTLHCNVVSDWLSHAQNNPYNYCGQGKYREWYFFKSRWLYFSCGLIYDINHLTEKSDKIRTNMFYIHSNIHMPLIDTRLFTAKLCSKTKVSGNKTWLIIGSNNGLSTVRRQVIIWTNTGILLIWPLGTNFSEILIEIHTFWFKKCLWKCRQEIGGHFMLASMC